MNQEQRAQIGKVIAFTAEYYGKEIKREVISMMVDDLIGLPFNEILKSYEGCRRDPKNRTMPLPAQIRAMLDVSLSDEIKVQQTLALIKECVIKKQSSWLAGYYWGKDPKTGDDLFYFEGKNGSFWSWREAAVDYFGPLGLKMVDHVGGWQRICEMFNENLESVIWSQLLKSGDAVLKISKSGKEHQLPQILASQIKSIESDRC